jgi:ATP-dependent DNA ligase
VEAVKRLRPRRIVLDGEIVVPVRKGRTQVFSFDGLLQRIHPAASRILKLSREVPAPVSRDAEPGAGRRWLRASGGNLDGIMAKRIDAAYRCGP